MKILKSSQIRELDAYTIKNEPIRSIDLMERAAQAISNWIVKNITNDRCIKIFAGPGNNGGDALAVARQLQEYIYVTDVYLLAISDKFSPDCQTNLNRLAEMKINVVKINDASDLPTIKKDDIILDGLFGSGLTRLLEGLPKQIVQYINNSGAKVVSIDIPSGLFGENNDENKEETVVKATYTLSFQLPKLAFMFSKNAMYVGSWNILPIGLNQDFINNIDSDYYYVDKSLVKRHLKLRDKFSHKGTYGHVLVVSGSYGKMGAAVLMAKASLKAGSGLVTAHIPKLGYPIIQTALPEAMTSIDWSDVIISDIPNAVDYTAVGVGPGIGTKKNTQKSLEKLLDTVTSPMVIDADALNILSERKELISKIPDNSILTPHPKEFERLIGVFDGDFERMQKQIEFSVKHKLYIILKGAHTAISCPDGKIYFNSTGNPGMATAGSGDVLTGIILSLLGQKYPPKMAAIIAVYLHGLAADLAVKDIGQEALIASDIINHIGKAYNKIRKDETI